MRRFYLIIVSLLFSCIVFSQTDGELSVTLTTSDAGGVYRPSHVLAIWVEDADGGFIKTLKAYASTFIIHLNIWKASTVAADTPFNTTDAITGATVISHETRNCSWDGSDYNGLIVPDGTYKLRMELTDKNATGNYSTFLFEKNENNFSLTPADEPSFSNISISWVPQTNMIYSDTENSKPQIYPNPSLGIININSNRQYYAELRNMNGQKIIAETTSYIDITEHPAGIYFLKLSGENEVYYYKLLKRD
jgi:hypothetical protein